MGKKTMNIVIVGHVDHGKSTLIGRLLADTDSFPKDKIAIIEEKCKRNSKPFEYSFLLDTLKDEQSQGITIDTARCFFKTKKRDYIIIDAPGHTEFLKNMVTGASRASAAILLIDVKEGIRENSKRHGYILSMLGIKKIVVAVNKMDLIDYDKKLFDKVKNDYIDFLKKINIEPISFIPISAFKGDNIVKLSPKMTWYSGLSILDTIDNFECEQSEIEQPFRMPVQDVYKFTEGGDDRRIIVGTIESGMIKQGDKVVFYPSNKVSTIKKIESFPPRKIDTAHVGQSVGVSLVEQIYVKRGEIMTICNQIAPNVSTKFRANIFWLGKINMELKKKYYIKIGTTKVAAFLEQIVSIIDTSNLNVIERNSIKCNEVAECVFSTEISIAFDLIENFIKSSRFVIVDEYEVAGGGIILESIKNLNVESEKNILYKKKYKFTETNIEERSLQYGQIPLMIVITDDCEIQSNIFANELEKRLVKLGYYAYYLKIDNFINDIFPSVSSNELNKIDLIEFAQVAAYLLDACAILITTMPSLTLQEKEYFKDCILATQKIVWIENSITIDCKSETALKNEKNVEADILKIINNMIRNTQSIV